jgi:Ca2+-binding RTX toxin-like protein
MPSLSPTTHSGRRFAIAVGAALAFAAVPASASASQVLFDNGIATYKPSGGEYNVITTSMDSAQTVRFKDTGTVIVFAGPGCQILNANEATCTKPTGLNAIRVGGGSFDDQIDVNTGVYGLRLVVESGSDDDVVNVTGSGAASDTIDGGGGEDVIHAGPGTSNVRGGPDSAGGSDVDVITLGAGNDIGIGGDDGDTINGQAGNDRIWGGAGGDTLTGGSGLDELRGQTGNDLLEAQDGLGDVAVHCGPGTDEANHDPGEAAVVSGCEL